MVARAAGLDPDRLFGGHSDLLYVAFSGALTWIEPANDVSWAGEMLPLLGTGPEGALVGLSGALPTGW